MKYNKKGFSIMIAMGLVILLILTAYVILSFIIPFMKTTKGVENVSASYYRAYSGVETALYHTKDRTNLRDEKSEDMPTTAIGTSFKTFSSGSIIPPSGKGNSPYSNEYNIISITDPIQLEIGKGMWNTSKLNLQFKIPEFNNTKTDLKSQNTDIVLNWILSSETDTLYAKNSSYILASDINNKILKSLVDLGGMKLNGEDETLKNFYIHNCNGTSSGCSLKFTIVNDLILTTGDHIPYLEYKIDFGSSVPDRYTHIEAHGKSYGYQKKLQVKVPQQTIGGAFDFTVFQ